MHESIAHSDRCFGCGCHSYRLGWDHQGVRGVDVDSILRRNCGSVIRPHLELVHDVLRQERCWDWLVTSRDPGT